MQRSETTPQTYIIHQNKLKMDKILKYKARHHKILEENMVRKSSDTSHRNIFTNTSPRTEDIKERINKWDFIKLKSFCTAKVTISKMKREPTMWENIFTNDTSDKGLISKIYKELTGFHSRKINNPIKNWTKDLNRYFYKEHIQRVHKHMEGHSTSLVIRKMQMKTTMRYRFMLVRMAIINKSTNNKCGQGCGEKGH